MELVAGHYEKLGSLFSSAMSEVFTSSVRSDMRGKALGTWLQSELLAPSARAGRTQRAS